MLTLGSSSVRLQASRAHTARASVPCGYRPIARQQLHQQRRIVAVAAGQDFDDNIAATGDRSTSEVPSDMAPGLEEQQTAKMEGGPADLMADKDVESSDNNPAMDPSEQSKVAGREGSETAETQAMSSESGGSDSSARDMSDQASAQGTGGSGGGSEPASGMASSGLQEQQTGKVEGGPSDISAGGDVESSDTNPAMDPSEQSKVAKPEESGAADRGQGSAREGQGQGSDVSMGKGSGSNMQGFPEGSLNAGGKDVAGIVDGADSQATITSDSAAARVEQVFGVGPEASPGAAEADLYQKEAKQEGEDDHSQTAKQEGVDDRSQTA